MKALFAVICLAGLTCATCARPERFEKQAVTGLVQKAAASSSNYKTTEVRVFGCSHQVPLHSASVVLTGALVSTCCSL